MKVGQSAPRAKDAVVNVYEATTLRMAFQKSVARNEVKDWPAEKIRCRRWV